MNYTHLTTEERCCIREFYVKGKSIREIAKLIGRSPSTVSREINRNRTYIKKTAPYYYPHTAQKKYLYRRKFCHRGEKTLKKNLALINARPKKVLNYKSPADLFELELKKCCT